VQAEQHDGLVAERPWTDTGALQLEDGVTSLANSLPAGHVVGRYAIVGAIGRGGMGDVYEAEHCVTRRRVALKIARQIGRDEWLRMRFLREAMAAAALDHPNVVDVLDAFEAAEGPVMVMELLRGETLEDLMKRTRPLDLQTVASVMLPVARALHAAHRHGFVHRDLKPSNIFLAMMTDTGMVPKILDFGIVKLREGIDVAFGSSDQATQTGAIVGTPYYMAYEQAMGRRDIDHRADIWSLGVIIYQALAGRRPLSFRSFGEMYEAFATRHIEPIQALVPDLPEDVASVIDHMVQVHPTNRLSTVEPLAEVLKNHVAPGSFTMSLVVPAGQRHPSLSRDEVDATTTTHAGFPTLVPEADGYNAGLDTPLASASAIPTRVAARRQRVRVGLAAVCGLVVVAAIIARGASSHEPIGIAAPTMVPAEALATETASALEVIASEVAPTAPSERPADVEPPAPTTRPGKPRKAPPEIIKPPIDLDDCAPPFTVTVAGVKRFKPHCLRSPETEKP
jgi:eukaryotic-like serine/threonine-protein kinase